MIGRIIGILVRLAALGVIVGSAGVVWVFWEFGRDLPDYQQLANYEPPVMTRVHAGDGSLITEYAVERRVFVPISAIPEHVSRAFLAAEDKSFYRHPGVDPVSILGAVVTNVRNLGTGRRLIGASTITQQVAQNFLLTKELALSRKIREAILAFRIERAFSKDEILELYLNEIYLGAGSYGIAAAALNYFNKSLNELSIEEAAFLAGLPKAPNNYNPVQRPEAAKVRRDYVIGRLQEDGWISESEALRAASGPVVAAPGFSDDFVEAAYFAEEVRRKLVASYGEGALYEGGMSVRTTLDPRLQKIADGALREGLIVYDRRHGWRGAVTTLADVGNWRAELAVIDPPRGTRDWRLAAVLAIVPGRVEIGLDDGSLGVVPLAELAWARPWRKGQRLGPKVDAAGDALAVGDVVLVEPVAKAADGKTYPPATFGLRQIPQIQGALVALDPHTGRVLAMSGGYDFELSEFNRVSQALRQPGSAFKPFVYMAALDSGLTPSSLILDAPIVLDQGPGLGKWKPANYTRKFYGPSPMRLGVEKSRNLMTVRLAQTVGIDRVADVAERFGVVDTLPHQMSMAIGAGETTLLRLTTAYAMIVNGGRRIYPTMIDRIQDRHGLTVFRHDTRRCANCAVAGWTGQAPPILPDGRERVIDPGTAYQMVSMLQGVVDRGTGRRISTIGRPLAGKTGTTNENFDTWFIGFSPDLTVGVYIGFDEPRSLGRGETGSSVAAPVFKTFMAQALENQPEIPFRIPPGIRLVRVNVNTGLVAQAGEGNVILEAFKPGTEPYRVGPVIGGAEAPRVSPSGGGGGIY